MSNTTDAIVIDIVSPRFLCRPTTFFFFARVVGRQRNLGLIVDSSEAGKAYVSESLEFAPAVFKAICAVRLFTQIHSNILKYTPINSNITHNVLK